ncbi:carboxypeptidase-like regulatory domain-containing protein [Polaribacter batillariae]|uniref:Carboxypeptidase-like regulatory domain-containing protein n=1 Tax=Polaribacter batillariae TaxID=2808900 RepID=A0ABX7SWR8_9FLAO|nr:carboxypeptidase-like regulatory domain-containing protein [Polaribacter batillariae]QTD37913.1 carboxypeptidase-like regulatory domain-containing protein [Polaribacter batillariae]
MTQKLHVFMLLFLISLATFSQTITGKVVSENSLKPIENVSIVTNLKTGTVTNEFGKYTLDLKNVKTITFSFLGYATKTLSKNQLIALNYNVNLSESVNQLSEIQLNLATISLDSLLMKSEKSMKENFLTEATKQEMYAIESQKMDFKKLDLELKSSSILSRKNRKLAEKELKDFSKNLQQRKPEFSSEYKSVVKSKNICEPKVKKHLTFYIPDTVEGYKKASIGSGITVKNISKKLQNIVLKHLSKEKTYKIKSGWFKVEDSLSFKKVIKENDSIEKSNSFSNLKISNFLMDTNKESTFFNKTAQNNFFNRKYYHHQLEKNEFLGLSKYYVISFEPRKSKAKYAGKIYIDASDFSVKKIAYKFADGKRGEHLNLKLLLGIKYSDNENEVTLYYEKNKLGKIYPAYYYRAITRYAYVNRPIKFIENTKERNKVKFNVKVEVNIFETTEVLLKAPTIIEASTLKPFRKEDLKKRTTYLSKETYENSFWKNRSIIQQYLQKY